MEFVFNCSHCNRPLAAEESGRGQSVICPACQQSLVIPTAMEGEGAVEILEEFRLPSAPPPPLSRRDPSGFLPPALESLGPSPATRAESAPLPPPPAASPAAIQPSASKKVRGDESFTRDDTRPPKRNGLLWAGVIATVLCLLVVAGIVVYTQFLEPGSTSSAKSEPGSPAVPVLTAPVAPPVAAAPAKPAAGNSPDFNSRLTPAEQQELSQLIIQTFRTLSPDESREVGVIYGKLSRHEPTTAEEQQKFNALFQKGLSQLSPEQQQRVVALFSKASGR